MNRRVFIKRAALSMGAIAWRPPRGYGQAGRSGQPNILLIMTDQLISGGMSCAGNRYLRTPALDRIATQGMRFTRAYVTQPLCMPCRSSMQTGRYPHEIGVATNGTEFNGTYPMLGRLMADGGYDCGYFGKWHVGVELKPEATGYRISGEGKTDEDLPKMAAEFLAEKRERPFFLTVSFVNPHNVCQLARGEELPDGPIPPTPSDSSALPPLPDNFDIPENEPEVIRQVQKKYGDFHYPTASWDAVKWRQYLWGYYRLIEKVDSLIGRVLDSLRNRGRERDTVVIFLSDHGEGVAMHHWNQKQILYDQAAQVPFLIAQQGTTPAGAESDVLVSTGIDLLPTVLDFAGIPCPASLAGKSLKAAALGQDPGWSRRYVVAETSFARNKNESGVSGRMLRTSRYKYIVYNRGAHREQLFDMQKDPGEKANLAVVPSYAPVLAEHRALLAEWASQTRDDFPLVAPR